MMKNQVQNHPETGLPPDRNTDHSDGRSGDRCGGPSDSQSDDPSTDQSAGVSASRAEALRARWEELVENIAALAHRRSKSLLESHDEDDAAFDRGARTLRTLMSSAEAAHRLKRDETKEHETDDENASGHGFTTKDIEDAFRQVSDTVDRIAGEDLERGGEAPAPQDRDAAQAASGVGCELVGGERP